MTFFSRSTSSAANAGLMHDVREQIDGERQMLVEHLDVVARVLLRRERVELAADGIDRLRDIFGRRVSVPLKSMCSTKCAMPLSSSLSWREPRISQTPMLTDRTCGIVSVMRRRPVSRTSRVTMRIEKTLSPPPAGIHLTARKFLYGKELRKTFTADDCLSRAAVRPQPRFAHEGRSTRIVTGKDSPSLDL